MTFRHLTNEEISELIAQNCFSETWYQIMVSEDFSAKNIHGTQFHGNIKLGNFSGKMDPGNEASRICGIFNSYIRDCEIKDHVHISHVRNLSNYIVESDVEIVNTGSFTASGNSGFGNGTEIEVLNEGGGRDLPIFDRLSAQAAYLIIMYRHDPLFIKKMHEIISSYCDSKKPEKGVIQSGARISDSLIIRNVNIGSGTQISGASLLEDGTIAGCREAPVRIGTGVTARKFIILSGSEVDSGAILDRTFVGQGVKMGKQFSSENSAFFANCEAFHGEACSLFAGPYSVTHHKSTLLIASHTSFFNAGSGTNQSNHMYKLGPLHQGILERGSKTGSFSYLLLPVHIGAYSVVVGKHYTNFDTSDFPFSYISEAKGRSELTPAMNLFTVGTRRDVDKWPARDRRTDPDKLDLIHFDLLNPFIIGKILNGINILTSLSEKTGIKQDYFNHKGIYIHRLLLKTTKKYYEMAVKIYIGQEIAGRLTSLNGGSTNDDLKALLKSKGQEDLDKWVDICGLFSPSSAIAELIESVKTGRISSVESLEKDLKSIYSKYREYAWNWCSALIYQQSGFNPQEMPAEKLIQAIEEWKTNAVKLTSMILKDAEKEFDPSSRIGYGIDGDSDIRNADFGAVRGEYEKNKFVTGLQKESKEIETQANRLISIIEKLR
jgi:hypothetical protein